jgi:hypothetical protein
MKIGCVRVSTSEQSLSMQDDSLKKSIAETVLIGI